MLGAEKTPSGRFASRCQIGKKRYNLGTFDDEKEAHNVYVDFIKSHKRIVTNDGLSSINDLSGNVYTRLTVLKYAGYDCKNKGHQWECSCSCGKILNVKGTHLSNMNTKSCGCYKKDVNSERLKKTSGTASFNKVWGYYRVNARRRNKDFNLTKEEFKNLVVKSCHYCNATPKSYFKKKTNGLFYYNGVDRKDSNIGYTAENCVPCCSICNRGKSNLPYNDYLVYINNLKSQTNRDKDET